MFNKCFFVGACVGVALVVLGHQDVLAQQSNPTLKMFQPGDKAFVQQEGFYHVIIPQGFSCEEEKRRLGCRSIKADRALLQIEIIDIPKNGTLELVALNYERNFKKKPHYQLLEKNKLKVDGSPAIVHSMRYDYLGNVQVPVGVQALYLMRQNKLFLIHFECALHHFSGYLLALQKLYATFRPAQIDAGGHPVLPRAKPKRRKTDGVDVPNELKPFLDGRRF